MIDADKQIERSRYDARAAMQISALGSATVVPLGSRTMSAYLRTPYLVYEQMVAEIIKPGYRVLELGAGVGAQTRALLETGAEVVASDISSRSLELLAARLAATGRLVTTVADMEQLPFDDASFDVVASAGSLSYGEPALVDREIRRVLRPGGSFLCVDSLNESPVYRFNRWLQLVRGSRTPSTVRRMPDLQRITALGNGFAEVDVQYFGALSFAMPLLAPLAGPETACRISDRFDQWFGTRRAAFKFVMLARHLRLGPG